MSAASPQPPLRTELAAGVLTLTLDRPDKRNALDTSLIDALAAALERADLDGEVRVVALRGAGKDFCAGADLQELLDSADRSPEENDASALRLGQVFLAIRRLPKPVVAVVQGRVLQRSGHAELQALDDYRTATGAFLDELANGSGCGSARHRSTGIQEG